MDISNKKHFVRGNTYIRIKYEIQQIIGPLKTMHPTGQPPWSGIFYYALNLTCPKRVFRALWHNKDTFILGTKNYWFFLCLQFPQDHRGFLPYHDD